MCQSAGKTLELQLKIMWLACAIESEGSLQMAWSKMTKRRWNGKRGIQIVPRVNLVNKDSDYIEHAVLISKELGVNGHVYTHDKKNEGVKHITWSGFLRVKKLLEIILPYLCTTRKKEIGKTILDFIHYRLPRQHNLPYGTYERDLFLKVRELNGKGILPLDELKLTFEQIKESSTTICQTPIGEDIVCSA